MTDTDMVEEVDVVIAGVDVTVRQQPLMYLVRRVKRITKVISDIDLQAGLPELLLAEAGYEAVCGVIPDVRKKIPLHAWMGYASAEAMAADEMDEEAPPHPPTFPELKAAFRAVATVNEYDIFDRMWGMLDPTLREGILNDLISLAISIVTPSSPSLEDGSEASTSSTPTTPTPGTGVLDSPSLASTA